MLIFETLRKLTLNSIQYNDGRGVVTNSSSWWFQPLRTNLV